MTLLQEIQAVCPPELIAAREHGQIAAMVSVGRTRPNRREVGVGTILETVGLTAGNALLDALYGSSEFRHVKPLLEQGRLIVSSPLVVAALQSLVNVVLTQAQADALVALGMDPAPVSVAEVVSAMEEL